MAILALAAIPVAWMEAVIVHHFPAPGSVLTSEPLRLCSTWRYDCWETVDQVMAAWGQSSVVQSPLGMARLGHCPTRTDPRKACQHFNMVKTASQPPSLHPRGKSICAAENGKTLQAPIIVKDMGLAQQGGDCTCRLGNILVQEILHLPV